ncbi:MAG: DNA alkylation repair protein [Rhodobacteraceae bacterium]|nr:MAG: DNA alkylation repair protein [Paracoccaceae bacterium]
MAQLRAMGDATNAAEMAVYQITDREFLGLSALELDEMARDMHRELSLSDRLNVAQRLWGSDILEVRILAAKLLTQARIRPDNTPVWAMISGWVRDFDSWALADHAAIAGAKRLQASPSRLDKIETWTGDANLWIRRAALVMTLPWARLSHPKPADLAVRERVLGWAAGYVPDHDWFIGKAIAGWLRELSKCDPARVVAFLDGPGAGMMRFARTEAQRKMRAGSTLTE